MIKVPELMSRLFKSYFNKVKEVSLLEEIDVITMLKMKVKKNFVYFQTKFNLKL